MSIHGIALFKEEGFVDYFGGEIDRQIRIHAKEEYPKESCGLIVDDYYMPCNNVHEEPEDYFRIDPKDSLRAHKAGEVRAVVHSHKMAHGWPSMEDMEMQIESKLPWGIVAIRGNGSTEGPYYWGCKELWPKQPYEGRPFIYGAMDCYSLCWDYYMQEFEIEMPIVPRRWGWWDDGENVFVDEAFKCGLVQVTLDEMQPGDMIYMSVSISNGIANHSAIYLGNNLILHHLINRLSRKEPFVNWRDNVTHVFRHESRF
jgi:proteasome lid subunit RPN8/RPN11